MNNLNKIIKKIFIQNALNIKPFDSFLKKYDLISYINF